MPAHLRQDQWPTADRIAWTHLLAEGDLLDECGPGAHWAAATRKSYRQHYARWLGWVSRCEAEALTLDPVARITPERVRAYAKELMAGVAPRTVASSVIALKVVARAMAPEANWRFLYDLANRLHVWATPQHAPQDSVVPIEMVHRACLVELERLAATPLKRRLDRVAYRDTLIVLVLSEAPVRLRNLAMIELGRHLVRHGMRLGLRFGPEETKNRQALALDLPDHVTGFIDLYLGQVRLSFLASGGTATALWLGFEGQPLTAHSIYGRVLIVTERLLGKPINPHAFRSSAATSLSLHSPEAIRLAAPLLGHRTFATTERHYLRAEQVRASRSIGDALARIGAEMEER
ncbi:MAG TPA: tyrosine-type recombinase/integrase [Salinarimonas sp.]|nr:tyrosine-type recombinase/integrase [Salinarimonas sp.]